MESSQAGWSASKTMQNTLEFLRDVHHYYKNIVYVYSSDSVIIGQFDQFENFFSHFV